MPSAGRIGSGHFAVRSAPTGAPRRRRPSVGRTHSHHHSRSARTVCRQERGARRPRSRGVMVWSTPQGAEDRGGQVAVAVPGHVQAVRFPHPGVLVGAHRPVVDQQGVVVERHLPDPAVELVVAQPERLEERGEPHVVAGEQHQARARGGEPGVTAVLVAVEEVADVAAQVQQVVAAGEERDQGRLQRRAPGPAGRRTTSSRVRLRSARLAYSVSGSCLASWLGDPVGPPADAVRVAARPSRRRPR